MSWIKQARQAEVMSAGTLSFVYALNESDYTEVPIIGEMHRAFMKEIDEAYDKGSPGSPEQEDELRRIQEKYIGMMEQQMPEINAAVKEHLSDKLVNAINAIDEPGLSVSIQEIESIDNLPLFAPEEIFKY